MKLNNKGFAISSIMYIILVLAVILISLTLVTLSSRKLIVDKLKDEVLTTIYEAPNISYRQTIKQLKSEAIAYMTTNSLEKESIQISDLNSSIDSEVLEKYKLNDKYVTAIQSSSSYNVYLGKSSTISNTTQLPKNTIDIIDYKIYGNSAQDGTPTIEIPIEVESVGEYDETTEKYKIPVKVCGKNIIDVADDTKVGQGVTVSFYMFDNINTKSGTYTFSSEVEVLDHEGNGNMLSYGYKVNDGEIQYGKFLDFADYNKHSSEKGYRYSFNFTVDGTLTFFYVYINNGCTDGQITLNNAMLTINDTDLTYEPYVEPIITNIYLNEPLRKIENYVDYIDFSNSKVVSQTKQLRLTSDLGWKSASSGAYPYKYCPVSDIVPGVKDKMFMCNSYEIIYRNSHDTDKRICYRLNYNGFFITDSSYASLDKFNTMLDTGNVVVVYPISLKEELAQLPKINTSVGATQISIDTSVLPSNYEFTVVEKIIEI